jgi:hypothetical protein
VPISVLFRHGSKYIASDLSTTAEPPNLLSCQTLDLILSMKMATLSFKNIKNMVVRTWRSRIWENCSALAGKIFTATSSASTCKMGCPALGVSLAFLKQPAVPGEAP